MNSLENNNTNKKVNPRFIFVVLDVKIGEFEQFYLGRINACYIKQNGSGIDLTSNPCPEINSMLNTAKNEYLRIRNNLPLLATSKDYDKLSKDKELIRKKSEILSMMLKDKFPLIPGESTMMTNVTILMESWERFEAGTVVYVQETNYAKVAYLLPYLNLSIKDASLRSLRGTYILTKKVQPQSILAYINDKKVSNDSINVTSVDPGKALLTFATVAAFALPVPYGVLLSGALSVVQMFFGGESGQSHIFEDAMNALLNNIQQYIQIENIKDAANKIETSLDWLNTEAQTIKELGSDSNAHDFIVNTALPYVSSVDQPNSDLRNALTNLFNIQLTNNNADWDLRMNAFDVLCMGVATYVTFLRVRTQMQAALESQSTYSGGKQLYAFYDIFRIEALQWTTKLSQRINDLSVERIGLVGELQRGQDYVFCADEYSCSYAEATSGYWTFTDNEPGQGNKGKWQDTAETKSSCGQIYYDSVQHEAEAIASRNSYIAELNNYLDTRFLNAKSMIRGINDALAAWKENLTPRIPLSAPGVEKDPSKWGGHTPQGSNWVSGAKVRYAVRYANSSGAGDIGPWGDWISIKDNAWPSIIDIPIDPLYLTTARHIYRQFKTLDGIVGQPNVITIIPDNQTTTYQDHNN